ncbi:peptidoglycan D,D-transpeptidase FtsI family protein (plasmid) [Coraliomargarita sp. W4R53]
MTTKATRSPRRRTVVALAVVLAVLVGFTVRLVDIQVVNADDHIADSMERAFGNSQTLYGSRGAIVDSAGETLAGSIQLYDCQLDPLLISQIDDDIEAGTSTAPTWEEVSSQAAAIVDLPVADVQAIITDALAENPDSRFAYLKQSVTTEQFRDLADISVPYIACLQHPARSYPDGAVAGNLVGFMGTEGPLEGLEYSQNDCLTPSTGTRSFQQGKDGVVIPGTEREVPAVDGGTLELTIDRDLQWYLQQLIGEQVIDMRALSGSIMVTEVKTGKIRAAAEYPSVDPNNVLASDDDDRASRIFRSWFEPGSTFKALTAATVLDAGGQTPTSTVVAASTEYFDNGARVRDAFVHDAYKYTLAGVLIDSSNAGISKFSEKVSPATRYDYFKAFGIGEGSAVDFPGEQLGLVRPADEWDSQTIYNTSYGQGLTTTIPELAGAYGAIANDGVRLPLSLVESCTAADGTVTTPELPDSTRVISEESATQTQNLLENVFLQSNYAEDVEIPGYRIAGKTGTGEKSENGVYKADAYFTTMIGFAPADDPEYLVIVTLDEPQKVKSSAANATAFQKAMTQVLKTFRVLPSTTSPTELPKFG